jgi:hypothetical protein
MNARDDDQLCSNQRNTGMRWVAASSEALTLCFLTIDFRYLITSKLAVESNPLVGSSKNKIFGAVIN